MQPEAHCYTFSVVALDAATGRLGSAVASRYFAVGACVPHLQQGVGAVNTQSEVNQYLGVEALALMAAGADPESAFTMVLAGDERRERRQLLAIDVHGRKAVWTGSECVDVHHHIVADTCVVAGNMLTGESVIEAMVEVMESSPDIPFGLRLIRALQAAEAEGGDKRGKQSAAVTIVPAGLDSRPPECLDLRADDAEEPVAELARLYEKRWGKSGW